MVLDLKRIFLGENTAMQLSTEVDLSGVGADVAPEEQTKVLHYELPDVLPLYVLPNEERRGSQKAVGHRLTIDLPNNVGKLQMGTLQIGIAHLSRKFSLEDSVQESFAESRSPTLIAKDETKRRRVSDNLFAIEEA